MKFSYRLYDRYTSTCSLPDGDHASTIDWTAGYFRANCLRLLPAERSSLIAEIGCGYGRNLSALTRLGYTNLRGVDISPQQIDYARNVIGLEGVECADARDWLASCTEPFDCILAFDVFEHLPNEDLVAIGAQITKALRPGGRLIVQVPNGIAPMNPIIYGDLTHVRAFTTKSLQQLFLAIGLSPVGYYETPPHVVGLKSALQRCVWSIFLRPMIAAFTRLVHGSPLTGSIFTSNILAVGERRPIVAS